MLRYRYFYRLNYKLMCLNFLIWLLTMAMNMTLYLSCQVLNMLLVSSFKWSNLFTWLTYMFW